MYAVIGTGGKQYKVTLGRRYRVDYLDLKEGDQVDFDQVFLIVGGPNQEVGQPLCKSQVKAKVVAQGKHKKINILHFKRRKHHMKRQGHRQLFTQIEITDIPGQDMPKEVLVEKAKVANETASIKPSVTATKATQAKKATNVADDKKKASPRAKVKESTTKVASKKTTTKKVVKPKETTKTVAKAATTKSQPKKK